MNVVVDRKHINSLKKADEVIDQIFDEHEAQLKAKDEEIKELGEIIAKQKQRIEELEATQGTRREWYQKGYNEAMNGRTCEWYYNEFDEAWDGKCGIKFVIAFDTPKGNNMNFCPCCGGKLIEIEQKDNA